MGGWRDARGPAIEIARRRRPARRSMRGHLGHLALHYAPGDEAPARRLLELLGCTLVDNGPRPGEDGFCTVLLDGSTATHAENLMFLSPMSSQQVQLESALAGSLGMGSDDEDPAVASFVAAHTRWPESAAHIGIRYTSLDELEDVVVAVEAAGGPGGELEGRVGVTRFRPRRGSTRRSTRGSARRRSSPTVTGLRSPGTGRSASCAPTSWPAASGRSGRRSNSTSCSRASSATCRRSAGRDRRAAPPDRSGWPALTRHVAREDGAAAAPMAGRDEGSQAPPSGLPR